MHQGSQKNVSVTFILCYLINLRNNLEFPDSSYSFRLPQELKLTDMTTISQLALIKRLLWPLKVSLGRLTLNFIIISSLRLSFFLKCYCSDIDWNFPSELMTTQQWICRVERTIIVVFFIPFKANSDEAIRGPVQHMF